MVKKDYSIDKNIGKILNKSNTNFLDIKACNMICNKLKEKSYKIYYPFEEAERVIVYNNELPSVKLLEIISYENLTHREIMGSLYATNINYEMFGDIIIYNNHYYFFAMESALDMTKEEFKSVGKKNIKLREVDLSVLDGYKRLYEEITLIVSSVRIDTVIARLIGNSRENVKTKFKDGDVQLNYDVCKKLEYNLNTGDIFSVRKYGKYKFGGIIKNSKSGNYVIKCYKYIDT